MKRYIKKLKFTILNLCIKWIATPCIKLQDKWEKQRLLEVQKEADEQKLRTKKELESQKYLAGQTSDEKFFKHVRDLIYHMDKIDTSKVSENTSSEENPDFNNRPKHIMDYHNELMKLYHSNPFANKFYSISAPLFYEPEICEIHNESLSDKIGLSLNELIKKDSQLAINSIMAQERKIKPLDKKPNKPIINNLGIINRDMISSDDISSKENISIESNYRKQIENSSLPDVIKKSMLSSIQVINE